MQVKEHWHQGIEIDYLIKGRDLKFALEGKTYHLNGGDIWVVNRNQVHSASGEKEDWFYIGLIIDDDFLLSKFPSSVNWSIQLMGHEDAANSADYQEFQDLLLQIYHLLNKKMTDNIRFQIMSAFFKIIIILDRTFNRPQVSETTTNPPLVQDLISYINEHHQENITASSIAEQFGVSQVTLNNQLKQSNQLPLGAYLKLTRLLHARQLLLSTDKPIEYIANEVGFPSSRVLNRNFKNWKHKNTNSVSK